MIPRTAAMLMTSALCASGCAHPPASRPALPREDTVKANIHLLVSAPILEQVEIIGARLASETGLQSLPRRGRTVHVTLLLAEFPRARLPAIAERLAGLCAGRATVALRTAGLRQTRGGWLFLDLERGPALVGLSLEVAERISALRAENAEPPSWLTEYPEKLESFRRYGSPNVGEHFEPHLTLLAEGDRDAVPRFLEGASELAPAVDGEATAMAIGIADEDGQVTESLWSCRLGGR